jgi:hypothetical protein
MKRYFFAAVVALLATLALAASASADVTRYQQGTLTVTLTDYGFVHTYAITTCGINFTGTGGITSLGLEETISGTLAGQALTFHADYLTYNPGYHWSQGDYAITWQAETSSFKNHGDFVSGGGDPHSLVGMPCQ